MPLPDDEKVAGPRDRTPAGPTPTTQTPVVAGASEQTTRAVDAPEQTSDLSLLGKGALALSGVVLLIGVLLLLVIGSQHDVELRHVPFSVVGPQGAVQQERKTLTALPGKQFDLRTSTFDTALRRLRERDVQGILVLRHNGSQRLYIASAASKSVSRDLFMAFSTAAAKTKTPFSSTDVRPLPKGDSGGSSTFGLALALAIGGFLGAVALFLIARTVPFVSRAALLGVYCLVLGAVAAVIANPVLGALTGHFVELWLIGSLIVAAVGFTTQGLEALLGAPGSIVAGLLVVVLSNTSSGGSGIPETLPDPLRGIGGSLPASNAIDALRGTVYFDGAGTTHPLVVLGIYAVAGLLLGAVANLLLGRQRPGKVTPLGGR